MTTATATAAKEKADEVKEKAAERQAALAEADATFKEAVAEAAKARQEVYDEWADGSTNVAERAWNETKIDEDPLYNAVAVDHRRKLDVAVDSIRTTGSAGIAGLEEYEEKVKELLAEDGQTIGQDGYETQELGDGEDAEDTDEDSEEESDTPKKGRLSSDFPHVDALRAAGINTYAQARALNGDYSSIGGIGAAKGGEIDAAL